MRIYIKELSGRVFPFEVEPTITVGDLKRQLQDAKVLEPSFNNICNKYTLVSSIIEKISEKVGVQGQEGTISDLEDILAEAFDEVCLKVSFYKLPTPIILEVLDKVGSRLNGRSAQIFISNMSVYNGDDAFQAIKRINISNIPVEEIPDIVLSMYNTPICRKFGKEMISFSASDMRLIFAGQLLEDEDILQNRKIMYDSTIHVLLRHREYTFTFD